MIVLGGLGLEIRLFRRLVVFYFEKLILNYHLWFIFSVDKPSFWELSRLRQFSKINDWKLVSLASGRQRRRLFLPIFFHFVNQHLKHTNKKFKYILYQNWLCAELLPWRIYFCDFIEICDGFFSHFLDFWKEFVTLGNL